MADSVSGNPVRAVLTEAPRDDGWHSLLLFPFDFNVNCHGRNCFPHWHLLFLPLLGSRRTPERSPGVREDGWTAGRTSERCPGVRKEVLDCRPYTRKVSRCTRSDQHQPKMSQSPTIFGLKAKGWSRQIDIIDISDASRTNPEDE